MIPVEVLQPTPNPDSSILSGVTPETTPLAPLCGPLIIPCPTLATTESTTTLEPPTTQSTTTFWPWNDLQYDYRYMWEQYVQELQTWANTYMVPIEHHNITVWPNKHPTISPNSNRLQNEYESYLANFEKWEAKNRPYVPTTPKATTPLLTTITTTTPTPLVFIDPNQGITTTTTTTTTTAAPLVVIDPNQSQDVTTTETTPGQMLFGESNVTPTPGWYIQTSLTSLKS